MLCRRHDPFTITIHLRAANLLANLPQTILLRLCCCSLPLCFEPLLCSSFLRTLRRGGLRSSSLCSSSLCSSLLLLSLCALRKRLKRKPLFLSVPRRAPKQMKSRAFNIERWEAKQHVPRIGNINIFKNVTFQNHVNCRSRLQKDVPRAEVFSEIYAAACTP